MTTTLTTSAASVAQCAVCGTDAFGAGIPHVTSESEARERLLGDSVTGWTQRHDGRLLCATCSRHADCTESGHEMGEWTLHAGDEEIEWRHCQHCGGQIEERLTTIGWPAS